MTSKPFRYLRFRVEDTNGNEQWMLSELQFFGNFVEE
jgi:hypothetical protein